MAVWRRKAIELFPTLSNELNDGEYSVYMLYFDLLPMVREAHDRDDHDLLKRIYGFAEWCLSQSGDLSNAAGVAFYEHLLDTVTIGRVIPWLSPYAVEMCWPLWKARLDSAQLDRVAQMIKDRRKHHYRELNAN